MTVLSTPAPTDLPGTPPSGATRTGRHDRPPGRLPAPARIGLLLIACAGGGLLADLAGVPAPYLLAALLVSAAVALTAHTPLRMPGRLYTASQAVVGAVMGSCLQPASLRALAPQVGPLLLVTAATVVLSLAAAQALRRTGLVSGRSAVLALVPGGSAAVVATADEVDADARLVAFAQYLRVALVALSAPFVVQALRGRPAATAPGHAVDLSVGPATAGGLLALTAVLVLGVAGGRRLRMPSPALLGPMVAASLVNLTGVAPAFAPRGLLAAAVFVVIGAEVGLRFTRESLAHTRRLALPLLGATLAVSAGCALLAALLATGMHISLVDAYLATIPGGINAVLSAAAATQANLPLVSGVQSLRLFLVVLLTPPTLRLLQARLHRPGR